MSNMRSAARDRLFGVRGVLWPLADNVLLPQHRLKLRGNAYRHIERAVGRDDALVAEFKGGAKECANVGAVQFLFAGASLLEPDKLQFLGQQLALRHA